MIYLDIDGVIITRRDKSIDQAQERASLVNQLAHSLGTNIVISSQRRISDDVLLLIDQLGLSQVVDRARNWKTPFLVNPDPNLSVRGQEIAMHMRVNGISAHLVFDDMPALPCHAQVLIDPDAGITQKNIRDGRTLWEAQNQGSLTKIGSD